MTNESRHPNRKSIRLRGYDYGGPGSVFITICSVEFRSIFGRVTEDTVRLTPLGEIVLSEWTRTVDMRKEMVFHAFVIMPNHVHALLTVVEHSGYKPQPDKPSKFTHYRRPHSIATMVAGFKGAVTRSARTSYDAEGLTVWQRGYHDRVIRDAVEFDTVFRYIEENPLRWHEDRFNAPPHSPH